MEENNVWEIENNSNSSNEKVVKFVRIMISSILAMTGVIVLSAQLIPLAQSYFKSTVISINNEDVLSPISGAYKKTIGDEFAYWDPGTSYFENLILQTGAIASQPNQIYDPTTKEFRDIFIDTKYSIPMSLSIKSLDISNVSIGSNIASYDENVYNTVLEDGLAHFKGTPLPDAGGNTFIYGHSAVRSFFDTNTQNDEVVFTKLEDIEIGDEVIIKKDNKDYTYIVRKKKIVEPDDFSILDQQDNKETVTLMTCSPVGIATHRLIIIAERI